MIKNFLITAIRALMRRKMHSFINILGLTIGMAATLLIISYIYHELSYDKFHKNYDHIYRIYSDISLPNGNGVNGPATLGNVAPKLQDQLPSVKKAVRMTSYRRADMQVEEHRYTSVKFIWADTTFFDIFSFNFIHGNPQLALANPFQAVLTEEMAIKMFGSADEAYEKTYKHGGELYKITGILENIPETSHIKFEVMASMSSVMNEKRDITNEGMFNFYTYVWAEPNADLEQIGQKTDEMVQQTVKEKLPSMGLNCVSTLQPLGDIHLKSNSFFEMEPSGDMNSVYIFSALAIFIILIAIINFINLVTANSETRAKEIGLRKVMGAFRQHLFFQFIGEAIIVSLISFAIALALAEALINPFQELMDTKAQLPYWGNTGVLLMIIAGVMLVGFLSGSYPALYLSRFLPVKALKGSKSSSSKNLALRKMLVVFQFTIAIFLLINLSMLYSQVNFMKKKDLGFDKEQVMVVENFSRKIRTSYESLKADLLMNPNVVSVAASQGVPGISVSIEGMHKNGENADNSIVMNENRVQYDYFKTMGIDIVAGRSFSKEMGTESNKVVLNETAIKELGLSDPINKKVIMIVDTLTIIGVCKDFHFKSLHNEIEPIAHTIRSTYFSYITIKLNSQNYQQAILDIESIFAKADPNNVFDYSFMDQRFNDMYQKEERTNTLITSTSILAIIISMLGLFALTSFTISQKYQEIGIRKALGSSEMNVIMMFVKSMTQWVAVAAVISIPLAYFAMDKWLERFVFHTDITIWMFAFGIVLALFIAIVTVGLISRKAAYANPVDALKYE